MVTLLILIGGQKGGSGKTTIAAQLGLEAQRRGYKVLLIDTDNQGSLINWMHRREQNKLIAPDCTLMSSSEFYSVLANMVGDYDHTIIDVAGRDSDELRAALGFSNVAIFPVRPNQMDLDTADFLDGMIEEYKPSFKFLKNCYFILSQVMPNPPNSKTAKNAKEFLNEFENISLLDTVIHHRSVYEKASIDGSAIFELKPSDKKANMEISGLFEEVFGE